MRRQLLVISFCCFLVGCGGASTNSNTFRLKIDRIAAAGETRHQTKLRFHPPCAAEIIVAVDEDRSSVMFDAKNPGGELESFVMLAAERKPGPTDGKALVEILIRPETPNGASAGGPMVFTVDADAPLNSILNATITEGEFPLDEPIEVGTLNGRPITLLVRRSAG